MPPLDAGVVEGPPFRYNRCMAYKKLEPHEARLDLESETSQELTNAGLHGEAAVEDDERWLPETANLILAGAEAIQGVRSSVKSLSTKLGPLT